ncbi:hypothetical protein V2O64_21375 [Verrucomicrobiaceae bacterium 227]
MIKPNTARFTAIAALLAGTCWLAIILLPPVISIIQGETQFTLGTWLMGLLIAMISIPGGYAIYGGSSLLRKKSPQTIKVAVGSSTTLFGIIIAALLPDRLQEIVYAPAILIIALPLYIYWAKAIMKHEGLSQTRPGELIGPGTLALISFVIYLTLSGAIEHFYPRESRGEEHELLSVAALTFGPILIAVLFYKVSNFVLTKRIAKDLTPP